jgi:fatty acid desaturase
MLLLVSVNLFQHDGCDLDSDANGARNFTSALGNWLLFNNGYHMIHHRYPKLHWSLLKEKHETEILPVASNNLQEKSLCGFFYRNYLLKPNSKPSIELPVQHKFTSK